MMDRRAFLAGTAVLLTAPIIGEAQLTDKMARIGFLGVGSPDALGIQRLEELREGLTERGQAEGRTFVLEIRWAEGSRQRLSQLAAELVAIGVDVIVAHGHGVSAAKKATSTIPIVMARYDDADARDVVASLGAPGGNVTGLSFQTRELSGKWVQLLKEVLPRMTRVAIMWDAGGPDAQARAARAATESLRLSAQLLEVRNPADFGVAFEAARRQKAEGIVILGSVVLTLNAMRLAALARENQLPAIYYHRRFAEAGGLLAYGPKESDFSWRRAAIFVDKILKGAKPADLPIEQPTKFELVINLRTAKAIGITIPRLLLLRADQVIE